MRTLAEWQRDAYALAVEKGFHDCRRCNGTKSITHPTVENAMWCPDCNGTGRVDPHSPTRIAARLALIHCEISEAVECVARGYMEIYFEREREEAGAGLVYACYPDAAGLDHALLLKQGYKPEGFGIELADVFLRLCDLAESLGFDANVVDIKPRPLDEPFDASKPEEIACVLNDMHRYVAAVSIAEASKPRARRSGLERPIGTLFDIAHACNVDLLAMAELKHTYNATRPIMHGGKVL